MSSSTVIDGYHVVCYDDGEVIISKGDAASTLDFVKESLFLCALEEKNDVTIDKQTLAKIEEFCDMMGYL